MIVVAVLPQDRPKPPAAYQVADGSIDFCIDIYNDILIDAGAVCAISDTTVFENLGVCTA